MKGIRLVALGLLAPAVCFAQTTDNASPATATSTETPAQATTNPAPAIPPGFTPPSPTGAPHVCGQNLYPPAAVAAGEQGHVGLAFRISPDGTPTNIIVSASSGYTDLDQAAVMCASQWKYIAAKKDGIPVETDWKANVAWALDQQLIEAVRLAGPPTSNQPASPDQHLVGDYICKNPAKPPAPLGKQTLIRFQLEADGSVTNAEIVKSSTDDTLDNIALACVSKWHFTPLAPDVPHRPTIILAPINW